MASPFNPINTRADLDILAGTPAHDAFMAALAGSVWRLEKDDDAKLWRAVQDASTIERFGFTLADFATVPAPDLPEYIAPPSTVPAVVTMRQARLALLQAGLLGSVSAAIAAMPGIEGEAARIEWEYAQEVRRDSGLVRLLVGGLGLTDAELDALFTAGAEL